MNDILGFEQFVDLADLLKLLTRYSINFAFTMIIVIVIYRRLYKNREFVFTFFLFNAVTFLICVLLRKVPMELGFALGLFAVFGILRYRTEEIRARDLTYLFIVLGLGILNAVANKKISLAEILTVNVIIVSLTAVLELTTGRWGNESTPVLYDNILLLQPERRAELLADLSTRTGVEVLGLRVNRFDMLRDAAELTVYHRRRA